MSTLDASGNDDPIRAAIDAAEEIRDPLVELVERTATDPSAAFEPETLKRLVTMKRDDRAAFEAVRAKLKKAGCRVAALDDAIAEENGEAGGRGPTQADILIDLAASADLFHAPDGTGFADLDINGHRETWPIRSKGLRRWLARRFFEQTGGAPGSEALQSALNVIEAKAHFDAPERTVHVRIGGLDDRLYLDLGDETWRAVEVDASGWRVIDNPPVRFRRAAGMRALPAPMPGGSVAALRSFLNVRSDTDFVLVIAWALACLRNRGPYPVIVLSGEQGSAKSTFSAMLRALLDPNTAPLRALPREDRDLFIAASNGHVLAFDNVSGLPAWISDTLCRLATGGGFAVRQLYSDQDEVLFDAVRPVILNGIEDIVTRPDLADRALFFTLEPIPEDRRRPEQELWAAFEAERPRILGALLDAAAKGLAMLPHTRLDRLPRMADFALWATACETALWPAGTFWSAYCGNRDEAVEGVIEADPIAAAVRTIMATRTEWTGTASELLGALAEMAGERISKSKTWPDNPRQWRAGYGGLRPSCARSASTSASSAKGGHGRGSSASPPGSFRRQKPAECDRPLRPHRPRIGRTSFRPTGSLREACGRSVILRTVRSPATAKSSATTPCNPTARPMQTVRTQIIRPIPGAATKVRRAGGCDCECDPGHRRSSRRRRASRNRRGCPHAGGIGGAAARSDRIAVATQGRDHRAVAPGRRRMVCAGLVDVLWRTDAHGSGSRIDRDRGRSARFRLLRRRMAQPQSGAVAAQPLPGLRSGRPFARSAPTVWHRRQRSRLAAFALLAGMARVAQG